MLSRTSDLWQGNSFSFLVVGLSDVMETTEVEESRPLINCWLFLAVFDYPVTWWMTFSWGWVACKRWKRIWILYSGRKQWRRGYAELCEPMVDIPLEPFSWPGTRWRKLHIHVVDIRPGCRGGSFRCGRWSTTPNGRRLWWRRRLMAGRWCCCVWPARSSSLWRPKCRRWFQRGTPPDFSRRCRQGTYTGEMCIVKKLKCRLRSEKKILREEC